MNLETIEEWNFLCGQWFKKQHNREIVYKELMAQSRYKVQHTSYKLMSSDRSSISRVLKKQMCFKHDLKDPFLLGDKLEVMLRNECNVYISINLYFIFILTLLLLNVNEL